jgi:hypothetical protein
MFVMRSDGMKQRPCHRTPRFNRENPRRQHLAGHDSCFESVSCLFGAFACLLPFRHPPIPSLNRPRRQHRPPPAQLLGVSQSCLKASQGPLSPPAPLRSPRARKRRRATIRPHRRLGIHPTRSLCPSRPGDYQTSRQPPRLQRYTLQRPPRPRTQRKQEAQQSSRNRHRVR